jgi:hypothetical protein
MKHRSGIWLVMVSIYMKFIINNYFGGELL